MLSEAFNVNLESLVTKDFLAARFAEQNAAIDTRFTEQKAYIDTIFAEQDARWEKRFAEFKADVEARFARLEAKVDNNFRFFVWTQAIVVAAVILPWFERLMAL